MHKEIAQYLFHQKKCPLPGLGILEVVTKNATTDFVNKQLLAPVPQILFSEGEGSADDFIKYVSMVKNKSDLEIREGFSTYLAELKNGKSIEGVGHFLADISGKFDFIAENIDPFLIQPVAAERVLHPEKEHILTVGDKEISNTQMSAYFNEARAIKKDRWWVPASVIALVSISIILYYVSHRSPDLRFGNACNIFSL
jgi:hypothetical protein